MIILISEKKSLYLHHQIKTNIIMAKDKRKFLKLHSNGDNSVIVINSECFINSQKNPDGSTKVTYRDDESLTDHVDVNETSEKINALLPETTIRLHISDDNTVACVSIGYIRTAMRQTRGSSSKQQVKCDTEVTLWDESISVNESPEKVYDLISDVEHGITEQIRANQKKARKELTKKAEPETVKA